MPKIIRRTKPIKEGKSMENLMRQVDKQAALLDYIAAMTDVQIPEQEQEMEGVQLNEQEF